MKCSSIEFCESYTSNGCETCSDPYLVSEDFQSCDPCGVENCIKCTNNANC